MSKYLLTFAQIKETHTFIMTNKQQNITTPYQENKAVIRTKEQERAELHKTIWRIANDLRGSVDGWDFKNYVLGMLFYRFISEDITKYADRLAKNSGDENFSYEMLSDKEALNGKKTMVDEKGYFILPSELFANVQKQATQNENLNITLTNIFKNIEESAKGTQSEHDLKGLFSDIDANSNKLGATVKQRNEKLVKILDAIASLDLGADINETLNDTFGDAYEFLMAMYASNAGKSGGEFFTPQEVSRLLTLMAIAGRKRINKAYDPACGSGSLLLQFKKIMKADCPNLYGQEINITTYNLCRINMFLHGMGFDKFDIQHGDTLLEPKHLELEPFDAIVSNPPYSIKWAGRTNPLLINDSRFSPAGVLAPASKADLAFVMHILSWLSTDGTAAIVEFPGVLYRGQAEKTIREYLISHNYVDTVIQLTDDLFFGVRIATCIIVLKKSKKDANILFIDASQEFVHEGNKNKLSEENIQKIYSTHRDRKEIKHFSLLVSNDDILNNEANLSVSSYIEPKDQQEKIDIRELNANLVAIEERQQTLRKEIKKIVAELETA